MSRDQRTARIFSAIFHPVTLPTIGIFILLKSHFYFSFLTQSAQRLILLIVCLSTFIFPLLVILFIQFRNSSQQQSSKSTTYQRVFFLLLSAVFYYLGYYLVGEIPVFPIFRVFFITAVLMLILLAMVSLRWPVSIHMATIGSLTGISLALSVRLQQSDLRLLALFIVLAGLLGTSRLLTGKNTPSQIYCGFAIGFLVNLTVLLMV